MPNPLLEPIIGRDFSDIGAQRYAWAGFNANIEAQNLARAAAAEEAQNRWALTAAQMAREDAARQAAMDANAQSIALNLDWQRQQAAMARRSELEQAARGERQFGEQMKFAREDLTARGEQAGEKLKLMEEQQKARVDFNGERYAAEYGLIKAKKNVADTALETAQSAFDKAEADLSGLNVKTKKTEEEIARQMSLSTSLPKLKADVRVASSAANRANSDFERIRSRMWAGDYEINEETGKISHPLGTREWSFAKAVAEAVGNAAKTPAAAPVTAPKGTSGPGWFTRNVFQPVYGVGENIGKWLSTPSSRPVAPVALTPTRYGGVSTPGHDLDYENAVALPPPPPAQPIAANQPLTGRFVRDASGRLVLERY